MGICLFLMALLLVEYNIVYISIHRNYDLGPAKVTILDLSKQRFWIRPNNDSRLVITTM